MDINERLQVLTERLDRLETDNRRLRAELADRDAADAVESGPATDDAEPSHAPLSRRTWFARSAAVVVGAVAGAAAVASPAAAAGEVLLDVDNAGNDTTSITASLGTDSLTAVFGAINNDPSQGAGLFGFGPSYGTLGFSAIGTGVWGKASGDNANMAIGTAGYIDNPDSLGSVGVQGEAGGDGQIGVKGMSNIGWGGWFESDYTDITIGRSIRPAPTADEFTHYFGDVVAQNNNTTSVLWFCVETGTPGTWRRLAGPNTMGATTLLASPVRVYDSRPGQPAPPAPGFEIPLATDVDRVIDCTLNASGVPADALAVLINLTATGQSGGGFMSVRANGVAYANTSNLNWTVAGQTIANSATVKCGPGARIQVRLGGAVSANVIVDVVGYMR